MAKTKGKAAKKSSTTPKRRRQVKTFKYTTPPKRTNPEEGFCEFCGNATTKAARMCDSCSQDFDGWQY